MVSSGQRTVVVTANGLGLELRSHEWMYRDCGVAAEGVGRLTRAGVRFGRMQECVICTPRVLSGRGFDSHGASTADVGILHLPNHLATTTLKMVNILGSRSNDDNKNLTYQARPELMVARTVLEGK
jgi:hypothetical protein